MRGLRKGALACGFATVLALVGSASALEMRPILTLDVARKIVDGCLAKAQQQGWKMHIAVLDIGGNLKAFVRMDDAQLISE
jgi:glc operon protein GlcG